MFPRPSGRGARLAVLPRTSRMTSAAFVDIVCTFASPTEVLVKFWRFRPRFGCPGWWLCFSRLVMLRCEVRSDSFTVLTEPAQVVMDKCLLVLHIWASFRFVSFPLLNTPWFPDFQDHSAAKETAQSWPIDRFRDSSTSRCTCQLPPILLSSRLFSIVPAGLKRELRSPGLPLIVRSAISVLMLVTTWNSEICREYRCFRGFRELLWHCSSYVHQSSL